MPDRLVEIDDRVLRQCTVRIDVHGSPKGTGFFVAPGHVVTCAHVLESVDLSAPDVPTAIDVSGPDGRGYAVAAVPNVWEEGTDDLAVLRVTPADSHRCVLLFAGLNQFDRLSTFAYPEAHPEGVPRTPVAEGGTGDDRLLSLTQGQIQPGMSGAPLVNLRTGGVCGVVSVTKGEFDDLGGYAIPIEQFTAKSPTLARQNSRYHRAHPDEWCRLLPLELRRAACGGQAEPSGFTRWVILRVDGGEGDEIYRVHATVVPGRDDDEPEKLPPEPVPVGLLPYKVGRLFRDWGCRGRAEPEAVVSGRFDPGEDVRLLGGILYDAVLPGPIGDSFEEMLARPDERIQLALYCGRRVPRMFVEMPWEHLHVVDQGVMGDVPVARQDKLAFVRVQSPDVEQEPEPPVETRLAALMVGVTPRSDDGAPVDEAAKLLAGANDLESLLDVKQLKMPMSAEFSEEVAEGYDVVHYVGFGDYRAGADRLALGGMPNYQYVTDNMFAALLAQARPRVVVLQEIKGPRDVVPADFSVFAWQLLASGVEAVVGYQFPLPVELSIAFNTSFYRQLATGQSFELAVQKARAAVWAEQPELHGFVSPAAFTARPGELRLTAPPMEMPRYGRVGVAAANA
jgi:hypothetical protein